METQPIDAAKEETWCYRSEEEIKAMPKIFLLACDARGRRNFIDDEAKKLNPNREVVEMVDRCLSDDDDPSKNVKVLVLVYDKSEFCDEDLERIQQHTMLPSYVSEKYGYVHAYAFVKHSFEWLRQEKLRMLQERGIQDDGTIFGTASLEVDVPEQIIPAHKKVINIEWECKDDHFIDNDSDEPRCQRCGAK